MSEFPFDILADIGPSGIAILWVLRELMGTLRLLITGGRQGARKLDDLHRWLSMEGPDGERLSIIRHFHHEVLGRLAEAIDAISHTMEQQTAILHRMEEQEERRAADQHLLQRIREGDS